MSTLQKQKLPGLLRTLKNYIGWRRVSIIELDNSLKEEFEVLWAYIHGVKNPLSNEDYLFFECKYLSCSSAIEEIVLYFTDKQYYQNFASNESLLYKGKQILSLLEVLHNLYEHKKYQKKLDNPFKTGMYVKSILDIILDLLDGLLHSDNNHVLIYEVNN